VIAADVNPAMERWLRDAIANAEPALARLTLAPLPPKGTLEFTTDVAVMANRADFIQENVPEQLELKQRLFADVSRLAPADVVIASSTSGLMPSDLQQSMVAPERFLVAHPFNPVYLLPLVELVAGTRTAPATRGAARAFFTRIGMHPLDVRKEVPGHLTDRLQEALWREILHLVNDGVATTGELDEAIVYGPGLRWAAMGTNMIYHLAGGEPGMRHMLAQFGPCLKWPWTRLEAPELTDALIDRMVEGTQAQAAGRSIRELEQLRDDCLVAIQQVLRQYDIGAGATLRALEARLYADHAQRVVRRAGGAQALPLLRGTVRPEWVDYNGHMTDSRYQQVFGDAMDALYRSVGVDEAYRVAGHMFYTVESHATYHAELRSDAAFTVTTRILVLEANRLRVFHEVRRDADGALVATGEQMHVHVATGAGKAVPIIAPVHERLQQLHSAQPDQPWPAQAGRHVGQARA
jgi:carnitine 3-dehydrogenase